jgi:thiol-disulfide isomerase/thioredoxin
MKQVHWKYWIVAVALVGFILTSACAQQPPPAPAPAPPAASDWMDIELTDVTTGQTFRISDFRGKPVLLESFAVWCPTCLAQQREIQKLKSREGDAIIHISLDTDPNEDEAKVREHVETHGFDWYFTVSPIELTNALIDEFSLTVVSAPSAPIVLISEDQSARLLRSGVKSADDLLLEIETGGQ